MASEEEEEKAEDGVGARPRQWAAPGVGVVGSEATRLRVLPFALWRKLGKVSVSSTQAWSKVAHGAGFGALCM